MLHVELDELNLNAMNPSHAFALPCGCSHMNDALPPETFLPKSTARCPLAAPSTTVGKFVGYEE